MDGDTRPYTRPKRFAALNVAFVVVLILYWAAAVAFFPLVDWYSSLPLVPGLLAPIAVAFATFWAARIADRYSRRVRGREEIDSRTHVSLHLTVPIFVPLAIAVFRLQDAARIPRPWDFVLFTALVLAVSKAWVGIFSHATIGDFTFEETESYRASV